MTSTLTILHNVPFSTIAYFKGAEHTIIQKLHEQQLRATDPYLR